MPPVRAKRAPPIRAGQCGQSRSGSFTGQPPDINTCHELGLLLPADTQSAGASLPNANKTRPNAIARRGAGRSEAEGARVPGMRAHAESQLQDVRRSFLLVARFAGPADAFTTWEFHARAAASLPVLAVEAQAGLQSRAADCGRRQSATSHFPRKRQLLQAQVRVHSSLEMRPSTFGTTGPWAAMYSASTSARSGPWSWTSATCIVNML